MLTEKSTRNDERIGSPEQIEMEFVQSFVRKQRRARYIELLRRKNRRGRRRFLGTLAHDLEGDLLIGERVFLIKRDKRIVSPSDIVSLFRQYSPPDVCYITSDCSKYDGKSLTLTEALESVLFSYVGNILHLIPGRLAIYCSKMEN